MRRRGNEIEIEIAEAADVDFEPAAELEIFFRRVAGIRNGVARVNGAEFFGIDARDDGVGIDPESETAGEQDAAGVMLHARGQARVAEFFDFVDEAHAAGGATS